MISSIPTLRPSVPAPVSLLRISSVLRGAVALLLAVGLLTVSLLLAVGLLTVPSLLTVRRLLRLVMSPAQF